ncbi:MAG: hypothetical protein AAGJ69_07945 [Cyanobacteria bacterium J06559_1]
MSVRRHFNNRPRILNTALVKPNKPPKAIANLNKNNNNRENTLRLQYLPFWQGKIFDRAIEWPTTRQLIVPARHDELYGKLCKSGLPISGEMPGATHSHRWLIAGSSLARHSLD